jgi:hypothetical protein
MPEVLRSAENFKNSGSFHEVGFKNILLEVTAVGRKRPRSEWLARQVPFPVFLNIHCALLLLAGGIGLRTLWNRVADRVCQIFWSSYSLFKEIRQY